MKNFPSAIKSYVRRSGRMTRRQKMGLQDTDQMLIQHDQGLIDLDALFGRQAPVVCDIGFGMGNSLLAMAQAAPELNFIGVEVYAPGVGALLADAADAKPKLTNLRVWHADVMQILASLPPESLTRAQLFFPDPWPKNKHAKRRLLQQPFFDLLVPALQSGGIFHMATDWQPYAHQAMQLLEAQSRWSNIAGVNQFVACPGYRPQTKYQRRGEALGHRVYDCCYQKN